MRIKTIIGLASAGALTCVGVLGLTTSAAFGAPAVQVPISQVPLIIPSPDQPPSPLPSSGPDVTIVGTCPAFLFTDVIGLQFNTGNAHIYRVDSQGNPGGANVEGNATLVDVTTGLPTQWSGMTHYWFGSNVNPTGNLQQYFGETVSFKGSAPDGSSISITANPGGVQSASGHQSGWGRLKVTCS